MDYIRTPYVEGGIRCIGVNWFESFFLILSAQSGSFVAANSICACRLEARRKRVNGTEKGPIDVLLLIFENLKAHLSFFD